MEDSALEGLAEGLGANPIETRDDIPSYEVERKDLRALLERLHGQHDFNACTLVTAVDRYPAEPRYEVLHLLLQIPSGRRVRVRTRLLGDDAKLPTCVDLWPGASFAERECFDMFGIEFEGHPDLRRLLMPQAYDHHPLRKDFPHQGIEPDRLYREWDAERRRVAAEKIAAALEAEENAR